MADSTINDLTALAAASVVPGTDVAPVWQGSASTTKKVTIAGLVTAGNAFGTITASSPATISQTWNNAAITFTGKLISITDTASNAASLLQDWQVGGVKKASITKAGSFYAYNTYTDASNYERGIFDWQTTANTLTIGTQNAGTGTARPVTLTSASTVTCSSSASILALIGNSGMNITTLATANINVQTAGTTRWQFNGTGPFQPAADNAYDIGTSSLSVRQIYLSKTITAAGTTGAQTINKATGSVNFAAAATSLVVTNSLVTTSSVIVATVGTNDTTMKTVNAVAAAGSFTLTANAAATAETRVNFVVLN